MNIADVRQKFPQYSDMSDDQLASALHRKFYSDMPVADFQAKIGLTAAPATKPAVDAEPSLLSQFGRQVGLTGRHIAEGITALPNMVGDAVNTGINAIAGKPVLGMPSQVTSKALTEMGLPVPQEGTEETVGAISRALTGVGGMAGLAKQGPQVIRQVSGMAEPLLKPLGEHMGTQATAAISSALSGEAAKSAGADGLGQFGAQMAGGIAAPLAGAAIGRGLTGARELVRPLTEQGQQQIVGTAMSRAASDPRAALAALEKPEMHVAGSVPTTAQAAGDIGLLTAERAIARQPQNAPAFLAQQETNNAARLAELKAIAGPEDAMEAAKAARDAKAAPIRERAFEKAKDVDVAPVNAVINLISKQSKNPKLRATLAEIKDELAGETNARSVYEVRKLIDWKLDASVPEHVALAKAGRSSLLSVKSQIDAVLNKATKNEFQKYLDTYSDMSKYVDRRDAGQKILGKFDSAQVDTQGNPTVTPYALKKAIDGIKNPVTKRGADSIFNTGEMDALNRVVSDLDRASLSNIKAGAGSDTFQNLATSNLIGRTLGHGAKDNTILRTLIRRPLDFLYKPAEQKMQGLFGDGMLDPKMGRELMMKQLTPTQRMTFKEHWRPATFGGLFGLASQQ